MRKFVLGVVDYVLLFVVLSLLFQAVRAFLSDESFFAIVGWVMWAFAVGWFRGFFRLLTSPK